MKFWGYDRVYGTECSIQIPSDSQYCWKSLLMYSPPLSDLMDLIFFLKLFSIVALKTSKISNTSDLCFIKYTQQNLEQSSIKVRKCLEPLIDVVGIGTKKITVYQIKCRGIPSFLPNFIPLLWMLTYQATMTYSI